MLYTEDFTMRHYVGFSQIGSHINMFIEQAMQLNNVLQNVLQRACKCVNTWYFQTNSFLSVAGNSATDGAMCQEKTCS